MTKNNLDSTSLILVEGKTDRGFIKRFLSELAPNHQIQVELADGVDSIPNKLGLLKDRPGFDNLERIAIIVDKDSHLDEPKDHFQTIKTCLESLELPAPNQANEFSPTPQALRVGIFVMPGNLEGHMLEDLLFQTLPERLQEIIKGFMSDYNSLDEGHKTELQLAKKINTSKAQIAVYKATIHEDKNSDRFILSHWDLNHSVFDAFKTFLQPILKQL